MDELIGMWAFRLRTTRWHLIESEIGDRFVMRCGRQMQHTNSFGQLIVDAAPLGVPCLFCAGKQR